MNLRSTIIDAIKPLVKRFPGIGQRYRAWRDERWLAAAPVATPFGFRLTGHPAMAAGTFEPVETQLVQALLPSFDRFVNVGANIGYYCCLALASDLPVVAVEPLRRNLDGLLANILLNGKADLVEVWPVAVADAPGILELFGAGTGASLVPGWAGAPNRGGQLTPVVTLDSILDVRFDDERLLVLMDVEGVEDRALAGSSHLLAREPRPTWLIEIMFGEHRDVPNPALLSTFDRFFGLGYRCWAVGADLVEIHRGAIVDAHAVAVTTSPFGTHNFLFSMDDPRC